jgi:hypothetical protein
VALAWTAARPAHAYPLPSLSEQRRSDLARALSGTVRQFSRSPSYATDQERHAALDDPIMPGDALAYRAGDGPPPAQGLAMVPGSALRQRSALDPVV